MKKFHVSKNVHTQLLDCDKNRVYSLETCYMISKDKPLVSLKEGELNEKSSAKERQEKKGFRAKMINLKGKRVTVVRRVGLLRDNMFIIFHPRIIFFITPRYQCVVLL